MLHELPHTEMVKSGTIRFKTLLPFLLHLLFVDPPGSGTYFSFYLLYSMYTCLRPETFIMMHKLYSIQLQ